MDKKHLQDNILSKPYKREVWHEVLKQVFGIRTLFSPPKNIPLAANEIAKDAVELGNFYTADERLVGIYEITLRKDARTRLAFNKVGLRKLLRSIYKYDVDGALIVFVQEHKWRFSYVSEIRTEEGKKETEPKRYTYLFGEGESSRTAADRFFKLIGKPIFLNDLYDAFSVDKLNKDFFKTYKEFYEKGVAHLAGNKTYYKLLIDKKQSEEDKKQKPIRDFVKKLLGRIVFLHFLQKKGWMGCPVLKTQKENDEIWLDGEPNFMSLLFKTFNDKEHFHSECLKSLFFETLNSKRTNNIFSIPLPNEKSGKPEQVRVPYLNGGLFDKDISFEHRFDFPVDYFQKLFDFFEQYNFTIDENDPYDSEVGIDPEMLGHIFENLLEENREKGAFYTPKEIVHYMCQESLIEYLHTQLPNINLKDVQHLIRNNRVSDQLAEHKTAVILNAKLKTLKVCDPAIGSGAFPMGTLKEVFECRRLIYPYLKTNEDFKPALVKKEIIQENIYGVDVEPGAVDIARLRFWLALVVDETKPHPLPNLDYKIMQGNSLLERFEDVDLSHVASNNMKIVEPQKDLFGNIKEAQLKITYTKTEIVARMQDRMKKFFSLEDAMEKERYRNEINDLVHEHIEFNFDLRKNQIQRWIAELEDSNTHTDKQKKKLAEHKQALAHLKESYEKLRELETRNDKPFFLWKLFFADVFAEGGFDIVIGNPPYINIQRGSDGNNLEAANFKTFARTGDVYCLFYEQGNNLLKPHGVLCYITSNKWMNAAYGKNFRKYLLEETNPQLLIDFSKAVIFPAAVVFVNILQFKKEKNKNELIGVRAQSDFQIAKTPLTDYILKNAVTLSDLNEDNWTVAEKQDFEITKRIDEIGIPIRNWDLSFFRGVTTGLNDVFHINEDTKMRLIKEDKRSEELIHKLLRGKDIKRYKYEYQNVSIIFTKHGTDIDKYPAIKKYLSQFKKELTPKKDVSEEVGRKPGNYKWFEIQDNTAYFKEFEKEKIVWIEISDRANYCLDTEGHYLTNSAYFITGDNLKFLLAVLNSRLMDFYFYQKTAQIAGGRKRYTKQYVELLPIPQLTDNNLIRKFELIVDYLIFLNDITKPPVNPYADNISIAPVFEDALNMMVNELYFEKEMKEDEIDVMKFVSEEIFEPLSENKNESAEQIGNAYKWLQQTENPIRNRIILSNIKSKDIIRIINSTTH